MNPIIEQAIEQARITSKLMTVVKAYDMAIKDPQFKAPSYLHAAIEYAREETKQYWPVAERGPGAYEDIGTTTSGQRLFAGQ